MILLLLLKVLPLILLVHLLYLPLDFLMVELVQVLKVVVMVQVLEGENAVAKNRELMGATNPKEAAPGTIRADFASSIDANAVHGSDSLANAAIEVAYFFGEQEICPR